MADVKWIKINVDMFDNRKIRHLRKLPDGDRIVLIWVMLLTLAGRCNANGMIFLTENIPYTTRMLADELDFEESTIILAIEALQRLEMLSANDDIIFIDGWAEHQNADGLERIREQNKKRVADYRKRKAENALPECNVTRNVTVTQCNAIEEEGDLEEDKDKEFHSFIHSVPSEDEKSDEKELKQREYWRGKVLLSEEQVTDLLNRLSLDEFNHYVDVVDQCEKSGKHYKKKSHYQAILEMAVRDRKVVDSS